MRAEMSGLVGPLGLQFRHLSLNEREVPTA